MQCSMMTLTDFKSMLGKQKTTDACAEQLKAILLEKGIRSYTFTYFAMHPGSANKLQYSEASEDMTRWHQHYHESGYDRLDSTLLSVYEGSLPVIWTTGMQLKQARSSKEEAMRQDSIDYGIEKGISVPVHAGYEDFAELVVRQYFGETCLSNVDALQWELMIIAHLYHDAIRRCLIRNVSSENPYQLTKRELQCLQLAAKRYTTEEIATTLHITARTVHFHMQRVNKKLGVANKFQAIEKALREKLLTL